MLQQPLQKLNHALLFVDVNVDLEELYNSVEKQLDIERKIFIGDFYECKACHGGNNNRCKICNGHGLVINYTTQKFVYLLKLTPDMQSTVIIKNQGNIESGKHYDLTINLNIKKHQYYSKSGMNLLCRNEIKLVDALSGYELRMPFLDGTTLIHRFDHVIEPGIRYTIKGKGMTKDNDLMIEFKIIFPKQLIDSSKDH